MLNNIEKLRKGFCKLHVRVDMHDIVAVWLKSMIVFIHVGAVSTSSNKPPKFLSSQKREKIRRKEMKERNLRY